MKFKSQIVTQVSGSVGGITYAHNRGGMYQRARSIPVNPNSSGQLAVRNNLSVLAARWSDTLTQTQRTAWTNYAANSPVTDVFGDSMILSGFQMYLRCNSTRLRGGLAIVDSAPVTNGLTTLSAVTLTAVDSAPAVSVAFDNTDPWATTTGGGLIVQTSRFVAPSINFFRSPFRYLDTTLGDTTTPPTSPDDMGNSNAFGEPLGSRAGDKLFARVVATESDGRLSPVQIIDTIVTAS